MHQIQGDWEIMTIDTALKANLMTYEYYACNKVLICAPYILHQWAMHI